MATDKTKEKAHKALDGMAEITKNEMLTRGEYLTSYVDNEKLAKEGAICGGHRACAIGSLYVGYGIPIKVDKNKDYGWTAASLPLGVYPGKRKEFTIRRPGLRLAMQALDHVAEKRIATLSKKQKENVDSFMSNSSSDYEELGIKIEGLFEGVTHGPSRLKRDDMLEIIAEAKEYVSADEGG